MEPTAPVTTHQPPPRPARTRHWRRPWWLAAALVLWLAGRGMGWFGDRGVGQQGLGSTASSSATPRAAERAPEAPAAATAPQELAQQNAATEVQTTAAAPDDLGAPAAVLGAAPTEAAPPAEPSPPAGPAGETAPTGSVAESTRGATPNPAAGGDASLQPPALDADRFASLLSLVDLRLYEQAPARALAVLAEIERLAPTPAQAAELAARRQQAELGLSGVLDALQAELRAGDVFAAQARVQELLAAGPAGAAALALLPPPVWRAGAVAGDGELRQPQPLAKGRAVWFWSAGTRRLAHVVDSRSDRATLRVASGGGATFPTVALAELFPVEPEPSEALSLAWAALRAGDLVLARCWLGALQLRAPTVGGPELAALAAALR